MQSVIDFPWKYKHVTENTQVNGGPCVLHTIVINSADAGPTRATVYDSLTAAGAIVAVIDVDINGDGKTHYVLPVTLIYDCQLSTGCYIAFDQQTSTVDLTVNYK